MLKVKFKLVVLVSPVLKISSLVYVDVVPKVALRVVKSAATVVEPLVPMVTLLPRVTVPAVTVPMVIVLPPAVINDALSSADIVKLVTADVPRLVVLWLNVELAPVAARLTLVIAVAPDRPSAQAAVRGWRRQAPGRR